jgi:hypothetical protein
MAFKMKNPNMGVAAKMAGDPRAALKMRSALKRTDIKLINVDDMGNETKREISKEEFQDIRNMSDQEYREKYGGSKPSIDTKGSNITNTNIGRTGGGLDKEGPMGGHGYNKDAYDSKIILTGEDVTDYKETQTDQEKSTPYADGTDREITADANIIQTKEGTFGSGKPNDVIKSNQLSESDQRKKLVDLFSQYAFGYKGEHQIKINSNGQPTYNGRPITYKMLDALEDKKLSAEYKSREGGDK